jgi:hypothetical protein
MHEIKIVRSDNLKGFQDDIADVYVNSTKRNLRNGETLVVLESLPANVRVVIRGVQTWEGQVEAKPDGSATVYAGLTQAIVDRAGWASDRTEARQPKLSAEAKRIQEVMSSNEKWMADNKTFSYQCYAFSLLPLSLTICAIVKQGTVWAIICGIAFLACLIFGQHVGSLRPAHCAKCNAPTLTRTNYDERFMGARSVQRVIRNQVTNQDEQRTATVSDIEVIEKWLCVTCNHTWTHKHSYVSE